MHVPLGYWMSSKKKSWTLTTHNRYLSVETNQLGRRSVFAINIHCSCTILSCFYIASTKGGKLTAGYPNTLQHDDPSMLPAHHSEGHSHTTHIHPPTSIPPFGRYVKIIRICTGLSHTKSGIFSWRAGSEHLLCTEMYRRFFRSDQTVSLQAVLDPKCTSVQLMISDTFVSVQSRTRKYQCLCIISCFTRVFSTEIPITLTLKVQLHAGFMRTLTLMEDLATWVWEFSYSHFLEFSVKGLQQSGREVLQGWRDINRDYKIKIKTPSGILQTYSSNLKISVDRITKPNQSIVNCIWKTFQLTLVPQPPAFTQIRRAEKTSS